MVRVGAAVKTFVDRETFPIVPHYLVSLAFDLEGVCRIKFPGGPGSLSQKNVLRKLILGGEGGILHREEVAKTGVGEP